MNSVYSVTDYSIHGDGNTNYTEKIKQLIEIIEQNGGGILYFPAGQYVSGTIELQSNMTLYLSDGATILASECYDDFPLIDASIIPGWGPASHSGFIKAVNCENIAIKGSGTFNGRGWNWWNKKFDERPRSVELIGCERITLEGVRFINSPMWTIHPIRCNQITIHNITIQNPADSPNTDGINPESCSNVHISNCHIDVGDDCIAIKSGREFDHYIKEVPCENITITNCTMANGHGGVVIGSEMSGGVRNITISNCIFKNTDRGIRIKTRRLRGSKVENIRATNIIMEKVFCPFIVNCFYPCATLPEDESFCSSKEPQETNSTTPFLHNFYFSNITILEASACAGYIEGLPELPIEGLTFDNIDISMDADPMVKPQEPAMTYEHKVMRSEGFHISNAKHVMLRNIRITNCTTPDYLLENCQDIITI